MSDLYRRFDSVFFEKTRLTVITLLYREGKLSFNALKDLLGTTDGAVYTHLEKLRQAGYIDRNKQIVEGNVSSLYELTPLGKKQFKEYVEFLEQVLQEHQS